jgi:hypothetical protein
MMKLLLGGKGIDFFCVAKEGTIVVLSKMYPVPHYSRKKWVNRNRWFHKQKFHHSHGQCSENWNRAHLCAESEWERANSITGSGSFISFLCAESEWERGQQHHWQWKLYLFNVQSLNGREASSITGSGSFFECAESEWERGQQPHWQ